jgi:hypothetical protein
MDRVPEATADYSALTGLRDHDFMFFARDVLVRHCDVSPLGGKS